MRYVNMEESHKGPLHAVTLPLEKENRLAPPALGVQGVPPGQQQRSRRTGVDPVLYACATLKLHVNRRL